MLPHRCPIKAVIVDIGGVVIRWEDGIVYRHVARIFGKPWRQVQAAGEQQMPAFERGDISEREFWRQVGRKLHDGDHFEGLWLEHFGRYAKKNQHVLRIVNDLKHRGYRTAAITNVIRPHYRYNKKTGLYRFFDVVVASCNVHRLKPDPVIYRLTARRLGVRLQECLFFDDVLANVRGARRAGMHAFVFRDVQQMRRILRQYGI